MWFSKKSSSKKDESDEKKDATATVDQSTNTADLEKQQPQDGQPEPSQSRRSSHQPKLINHAPSAITPVSEAAALHRASVISNASRSLTHQPSIQSIGSTQSIESSHSTESTESTESSTSSDHSADDANFWDRPIPFVRRTSSTHSRRSSNGSRRSSGALPAPLLPDPFTDNEFPAPISPIDESEEVSAQLGEASEEKPSQSGEASAQAALQVPAPAHHRRESSNIDSPRKSSQHRRHSSQIAPESSRHRRKSSQIAPDSSRQNSVHEHQSRAHSRQVSFSIPEDAVVQEADATNPSRPIFNRGFTLDGNGRVSDSLQNQHLLTENDSYNPGQFAQFAGRRKSSCILVNRRASKYTIAEEKEVRAVGKKRLHITRNVSIVVFVVLQGGFTAISWLFPKYWYAFAPVILLGNVLNSIMVLNLLRYWIWNHVIVKACRWIFRKPKAPLPTHIPTTIAMVLACYCESYTDLMRTLDSLSEQEKVDHHKKMFLVICDGQVKGKGMEKSTDRILVEDIFQPDEEHYFPVGYESWDGAINGIYASSGVYNGIPYCCIVKKRNLGKRDGLILIRTLLYKYEQRHENPITSMGSDFFEWFCNFSESQGIEKFEWLVGVDADTTFNKECIYELHKDCLVDDRLLGSSGLIQVGWQTGNWNLWNVYQNTEYMRAQCLRRMHQAKGTGKVSCLPGACQIIKICEESCGDDILIDTFGHLPDPKDNMIKQIRALAGEDRNYICLIFARYPKVITTMSMGAIAYTDPPNGFWVFLSQRKRWTLSTCSNDLLIIGNNNMQWFERICSLADVLVWGLPWFVMQTFGLFIRACVKLDSIAYLLGFASVTIIPIIYGVIVTFWGCHGVRFRLQYLLGLFMVIAMSQFVTPVVILYAIWKMDNFSWGKTREIEDDGNPDNKPAHSD